MAAASSSSSSSSSLAGKILTFDVGGRIFKTTLATLERQEDNVLSHLARGAGTEKRGIVATGYNAWFIDASPDLFAHILDYCRGCIGAIMLLPELVCCDLVREARMYGMPGLVNLLVPSVNEEGKQRGMEYALKIRTSVCDGAAMAGDTDFPRFVHRIFSDDVIGGMVDMYLTTIDGRRWAHHGTRLFPPTSKQVNQDIAEMIVTLGAGCVIETVVHKRTVAAASAVAASAAASLGAADGLGLDGSVEADDFCRLFGYASAFE